MVEADWCLMEDRLWQGKGAEHLGEQHVGTARDTRGAENSCTEQASVGCAAVEDQPRRQVAGEADGLRMERLLRQSLRAKDKAERFASSWFLSAALLGADFFRFDSISREFGRASIFFAKRFDFLCRQGDIEQEALSQFAADFGEEFALLVRLDSLGKQPQPKILCQGRKSFQQCA